MEPHAPPPAAPPPAAPPPAAPQRTLRAVIADDEPLARERLRTLLAREGGVEVVAECANGHQALAAVEAHRPDLLLLDVQMPECGGFEVVEALPPEDRPVIVFVTAYEQFAVRAFSAHVLDYLLKPFDRARFAQALARARRELEGRRGGEPDGRVEALLAELRARRPPAEQRLVVKGDGKVLLVPFDAIDYVEAEGNYALVHAGGRAHLLRETLTRLEARLDGRRFLRIHRSTIVNLERVEELQPLLGGEYVVVLRGGTALTSGRTYRARLHEALGLPA
jgi:two-component system LytT family response regulator